MLFSLLGGLLGVLISVWATGGLSAFRFPVPVTLDLNVGIDYKVLLFTFLLSLATGVPAREIVISSPAATRRSNLERCVFAS